MEWITPKTNWSVRLDSDGNYIGDFFNKSDYERIVNNLLYIKELYVTYKKPRVPFESFSDITYESLAYAEDINKIERNLERLIKYYGGLNALIGHIKTYVTNGKTIDFDELNRIEGLTLKIYEYLPIEYKHQRKLEFSLGLDNIGEFSTLTEGVL